MAANRGLIIGLGAAGAAVLLLACCVCGGGGAWFGVAHYTATTGSPGPAKVEKKVTDATAEEVKTGMTLEEVEAILGKGSSTSQAELYKLWQNKESTTAKVNAVISQSITGWYVWTNGNLFLAVGLSATRSRTDRVSVIVYRDSRGAITPKGGDPEKRP